MVVSVSFYGQQRRFTQMDNIQIPLSDETRVGDVLDYIIKSYPGLPIREDAILATVNNCVSSLSRSLQNKDKISFIPHIGGG